jgi:TRAP-type uncharacterized transport system substrate-binding protein
MMLSRSARYAIAAIALLSIAAAFAALYWWSPHATLRITTGPLGGTADRFISALKATSKTLHPLVRLDPIQVGSLKDSSTQLEAGNVDLAIVRTDVAPPSNGQTIAILRRDAVGILVPPHSKVDSVAGLSGKTVLLLSGRAQDDNAALLDTVLGYYNVPSAAVHREVVAPADLSKAVRKPHVAAVMAVGPLGVGELTDAVATITKAVGAPTIMAFDDADAFTNSNPGVESLDVPKGVLRSRPEIPDDTVTVLAVTYRLVAPFTMLNVEAGAIARSLLTTKSKFAEAIPLAAHIEAPDPEKNTAILPVHPGVAEYLSSGEQSFLNELQGYAYGFGIAFSVLASAGALLSSYITRRTASAIASRSYV